MIENGCGLSWWSPSFAFYSDDPIRIPLKSIFFILHDWFNQAKINEKEAGHGPKIYDYVYGHFVYSKFVYWLLSIIH